MLNKNCVNIFFLTFEVSVVYSSTKNDSKNARPKGPKVGPSWNLRWGKIDEKTSPKGSEA